MSGKYNQTEFTKYHCSNSESVIEDTIEYLYSLDIITDDNIKDIARRMKRTDDNYKWYNELFYMFKKKGMLNEDLIDIFMEIEKEKEYHTGAMPREHMINYFREVVKKLRKKKVENAST